MEKYFIELLEANPTLTMEEIYVLYNNREPIKKTWNIERFKYYKLIKSNGVEHIVKVNSIKGDIINVDLINVNESIFFFTDCDIDLANYNEIKTFKETDFNSLKEEINKLIEIGFNNLEIVDCQLPEIETLPNLHQFGWDKRNLTAKEVLTNYKMFAEEFFKVNIPKIEELKEKLPVGSVFKTNHFKVDTYIYIEKYSNDIVRVVEYTCNDNIVQYNETSYPIEFIKNLFQYKVNGFDTFLNQIKTIKSK